MIRCQSPNNPQHVRFVHRYDLGVRKWRCPRDEQHACPICIQYVRADGVRLEACGHTFHGSCLVEWFRRATTCPMCRTELDGETSDEEIC